MVSNAKVNVMVNLPIEIKAQVDQLAEKDDIPVSAVIRRFIAAGLGIELPDIARGRARKYATVEERKAAMKVKAQAQRELVKDLLAKYKAGLIK